MLFNTMLGFCSEHVTVQLVANDVEQLCSMSCDAMEKEEEQEDWLPALATQLLGLLTMGDRGQRKKYGKGIGMLTDGYSQR